jgi:hypothetical protein
MSITVQTVPSSTSVTVQDSNNLVVNIQGGNQVALEVSPPAQQTIQINRGVAGASGPTGPTGNACLLYTSDAADDIL